jgi:hypothetical protein
VFVLAAAGQGVDFLQYVFVQPRSRTGRPATAPSIRPRSGDPRALSQHPIAVEQRLLNPSGGEERPGALEEPLAFEVEAPRGSPLNRNGLDLVEVQDFLEQLDLEDRIVLGVLEGEGGVVIDAVVAVTTGSHSSTMRGQRLVPVEIRDDPQHATDLEQHLGSGRVLLFGGRTACGAVDPPSRKC